MRLCSPDSIQKSCSGGCFGHCLDNAVQPEVSLEECFKAIDKLGIDGALIIRGEEMAVWGELPQIRRVCVGGGAEDNEGLGMVYAIMKIKIVWSSSRRYVFCFFA